MTLLLMAVVILALAEIILRLLKVWKRYLDSAPPAPWQADDDGKPNSGTTGRIRTAPGWTAYGLRQN